MKLQFSSLNIKVIYLYMVFPSSKAKEGMSVTTKMCEYFENLMKPLVTNELLKELPSSIKRLEEKIQSAKKSCYDESSQGPH